MIYCIRIVLYLFYYSMYPKINIGIGSLVLNDKSDILLIKRKTNAAIWTIPSGYMNRHEELFNTVTREIKEETNILIKPLGIVGVRQRITPEEGNNIWIIIISKYLSGNIIPDNIEILKADFIPLSKVIQKNISPVTRHLINLLMRDKLKILSIDNKSKKTNYKLFT